MDVPAGREEHPAEEPVFIIRAADALACPLLSAYHRLCGKNGAAEAYLTAVEAEYTRFADWQELHPDRVKVPDTRSGEYWQGPSAFVVVVTGEAAPAAGARPDWQDPSC